MENRLPNPYRAYRSSKACQAAVFSPGRLLLCLALLLGIAWGGWQPAFASSDPVVGKMRVQVLPEYDTPQVLVIVQGRLELTEDQLPVPVTFRVPKGAQINQMAVMNIQQGVIESQPYDVQADPEDGRWSLVSYTLDDAHFFYEYYYDPLQAGSDKQFTFEYSSLLPVTELLVEVQQPLKATDFELNPAAAGQDDRQGFSYYQYELGHLQAGEGLSVEVNYTKTDPAPSVAREPAVDAPAQAQLDMAELANDVMGGAMLPAEPEAAAPQMAEVAEPQVVKPQPAETEMGQIWYFVVFAVVFLAVIAAVVVWSRVRGGRPSVSCPRCGKGSKADARFCSACGTYLGARVWEEQAETNQVGAQASGKG